MRRAAVLWAGLSAGAVLVLGALLVALFRDWTADRPEEDEERRAAMHHSQHGGGRYYLPVGAETEDDGDVVLRYEIEGVGDSSVEDFVATYDIEGPPRKTGPDEVTYADEFDGVRRTFVVRRQGAGAPVLITVTARP
ncbi:hypothetical protein ACIBI4_33565 [Streptomyces sp. NPDC050418]|uniref:hypothetical protein n=1 Tax=Streptomyces sp. NPDC050418 TaxID=3365612 RepID=UPI00378EFF2E